MKWYYRDAEKTVGPLAETSIRELHACGMIADDTQVREDNSDVWIRFDQAFGSAGKPDGTAGEECSINPIKFHCPHCQQKISADPGQVNESVQCPSCGADFVVPSSSHEEEVPPISTPQSTGNDSTDENPISSPPPSLTITAGQSLKSYHVIRNGEQSGPYSIAEITGKIAAGELSPGDLCWEQSMSGWEPLHKVLSLGAGAPPPPPLVAGQSASTKPSSSGLGDALKNLFGSLAALCGTLFKSVKSAATSETAQHAKQKVAETSTMLRTRASEMASAAANSEALRTAAEKINKSAVELQKKAANLTHQGEGQPIASLPTTAPGSPVANPPPPPHPAATFSGPPVNGGSPGIAAAGEPNRRPIKWIPALVSFCLMAAFWCLSDLAILEDGNPEDGLIYLLAGLPVAIIAVTFFSLLHYKCWNSLPGEFRATTPGKAVGFMFIPLFNFYWAFMSWPKLSDGLANWQATTGITPKNTKGLGITFAILFICHWVFEILSIPALGLMVKIALLVIFILYYRNLVRDFNQMLGSSPVEPEPLATGFWSFKRSMIGVAVVLLYWVILGVTYDPVHTPSSSDSGSSGERLPSWYTQVQGMKTLPCPTCSGSGVDPVPSHCFKCSGGGTTKTGSGYIIVCPSCGGTGKKSSSCRGCGGSGQVKK